ncbi:MAG: toxin-antitoxin system HicB family antitoxin [Castellaniella sp.]|uniref:toxin-antitoxin system HicB family antitoxin n=1 Tax=Castellaniella sp. TaxID=1955812 RepID=UPI0011F9C024|nr:toxin-antitoxin system HicB family antitoxin [Castellaniella sp.]TAN30150.1 MAG: toxin-antitoxin system HicB family antitoxin [Castellaniella sp.]
MQKIVDEFDPSLYTIEIKRVETEDGMLYEAKVKEVPGIASYADCAQDAFEEAREAIQMLYALAKEQGQSFPTALPQHSPEHSGRVTLRLSKSLHYRASLMAEHEEVSLNTLISEALAERVFGAYQAAPKPTVATATRERIGGLVRDMYQVSLGATKVRLDHPKSDYRIVRKHHGDEVYSF